MRPNISYKLIGPGWADCLIVHGDESKSLSASYLEDAQGNLAEATLRIARGEKLAYAIFAEEPGEYRWKLSRKESDQITVEILWFEEWNSLRVSDDKGNPYFSFECSKMEFVRCVIDCLSDVLREYGSDGYAVKWILHEFPSDKYEKLRKVLPSLKNK